MWIRGTKWGRWFASKGNKQTGNLGMHFIRLGWHVPIRKPGHQTRITDINVIFESK